MDERKTKTLKERLVCSLAIIYRLYSCFEGFDFFIGQFIVMYTFCIFYNVCVMPVGILLRCLQFPGQRKPFVTVLFGQPFWRQPMRFGAKAILV